MEVDFMLYRSRCDPAHHIFEHWGGLPDSYGEVIALTSDQQAAVLVPCGNIWWLQLKRLANHVVEAVALAPSMRYTFFHRLVARSLDPPREGDGRWYLWGHVPCPICGAIDCNLIGPATPPRYERRDLQYGSQVSWAAMTEEERVQAAQLILDMFKSDWGHDFNPKNML